MKEQDNSCCQGDGVMNKEQFHGITAIFTGEGKGKTSAALGVVCRALGHGCRIMIIQFIKGAMTTGEVELSKRLPELNIVQVGRGFTWEEDVPEEEHRKAAQEGVRLAGEALASGEYRTVVLDEILYALGQGLVSVEQVENLIEKKPPQAHLVLTGRGAPERLIEKADLVTEMRAVKHPAQAGIPAQRCMDY